jgi:hypothetical protein
MTSRLHVGLDFDNTIICYDEVFLSAARARRLVPAGFAADKQAIREAVRRKRDGELAWQRLQSYAYAQGIGRALLHEGVDHFLRRCRSEGVRVSIVSHKTEFGHFNSEGPNLREAASSWMHAAGFFSQDGLGLRHEDVFWESTRAEKLERIASLRCTHFVDDLVEVLTDPAFPEGVVRLLFARGPVYPPSQLYVACRSWSEVESAVFGD